MIGYDKEVFRSDTVVEEGPPAESRRSQLTYKQIHAKQRTDSQLKLVPSEPLRVIDDKDGQWSLCDQRLKQALACRHHAVKVCWPGHETD